MLTPVKMWPVEERAAAATVVFLGVVEVGTLDIRVLAASMRAARDAVFCWGFGVLIAKIDLVSGMMERVVDVGAVVRRYD
jgi:hypothetical protein